MAWASGGLGGRRCRLEPPRPPPCARRPEQARARPAWDGGRAGATPQPGRKRRRQPEHGQASSACRGLVEPDARAPFLAPQPQTAGTRPMTLTSQQAARECRRLAMRQHAHRRNLQYAGFKFSLVQIAVEASDALVPAH